MLVEIAEQLAVLPQSLVEPDTVLDVEFDGFLADDRLHLAHVSILSAASAKRVTSRAAHGRRSAASSPRGKGAKTTFDGATLLDLARRQRPRPVAMGG
jgi:hypothetical protein